MNMKRPYQVYVAYFRVYEDEIETSRTEWSYMGQTYAVSETQAINNVRYRTRGKKSQYKPTYSGNRVEEYMDWIAIVGKTPLSQTQIEAFLKSKAS